MLFELASFACFSFYRKPQEEKGETFKGKCKVYEITAIIYACGEWGGSCAVENCNLGRNVRNSSIVNLSPINGIKIYGVHTHSLSHTFFLLLMPLFSYMPNRVNLWGLFHLGRSFYFFCSFHFTLLTQKFVCFLLFFSLSRIFCWLVISV